MLLSVLLSVCCDLSVLCTVCCALSVLLGCLDARGSVCLGRRFCCFCVRRGLVGLRVSGRVQCRCACLSLVVCARWVDGCSVSVLVRSVCCVCCVCALCCAESYQGGCNLSVLLFFSNISLVARASDSLGLSRFYTFGGHYRGGVRGSLLSCLARPLHANASLRLADMCGGACALSGAVWRVAGAYPVTCLGWAEW